ncbi:MAG: rhamnulokinase [Chloroflexi bacterium]|nr:rhamnulokinase [Chloroflexota bacterium]MCI0576166.1 rhamnulokinase [Chloroflexota bacterium]MCI0648981.1 rhamnulokinase [Chloroflexota bacterium]MCI0728197.1 rhamnulokinase [Chloroflexota bacterium]
MSQTANFLAFDLGAESGRAVLGRFDGERLSVQETHRFANGPVRLPDGLHWDVLHLFTEIKRGLALTAHQHERDLAALGVDTWGVDFALLDRDGRLIGDPYHYRDSRTDGMMARAFQAVPREEIFAQTGIQFMQINTLYQLLAMVAQGDPALAIARTFLTIPDLFNYWLTGQKVCEFTNSTTTQCVNPHQKNWARPLLKQLGIPGHLFPEIVPPGTIIGPLTPAVAGEVGSAALPVIAPACHDTGSAVAAVPAEGTDFAWISSGTWSIMGVELPEAVVNDQALAANLTNEGGVAGTFRLSKNVMGLWLVQECRRAWASEDKHYSYDDLAHLAAQARPFPAVIDPDDEEFLKPGEMPARIRAYCRRTGQPLPEDDGALVRCVLESLALKYRWVLEQLEVVTGRRLEPIHVLGGGGQNRLLNQLTADATNRQVITGPVEATATGNILAQAITLGHLASLREGRELVRRSFDVTTYEPAGRPEWEEAYQRLLAPGR